MKLTTLLLSIVAAASMFAAEPTDSTKNTSGPAKARVFVYRYKQFTGSALSPSIYCDDQQLARMTNGNWFSVELEPGKHVIRSNDKQAGLESNPKPGEQYFIRVEIAPGMM